MFHPIRLIEPLVEFTGDNPENRTAELVLNCILSTRPLRVGSSRLDVIKQTQQDYERQLANTRRTPYKY